MNVFNIMPALKPITNFSSFKPIHFQMKLIVERQCRVFLLKNFHHDISSVTDLDYTYSNPFSPMFTITMLVGGGLKPPIFATLI
jgi:hypothetical protein